MSLLDKITADGAGVFLQHFAEDVFYQPGVGPGRTIKANVIRESGVKDPASTQVVTPQMLIEVANDPVLGIAAQDLDTGVDTITVAQTLGGTEKAWNIRRRGGNGTGQQDPGMLKLELR